MPRAWAAVQKPMENQQPAVSLISVRCPVDQGEMHCLFFFVVYESLIHHCLSALNIAKWNIVYLSSASESTNFAIEKNIEWYQRLTFRSNVLVLDKRCYLKRCYLKSFSINVQVQVQQQCSIHFCIKIFFKPWFVWLIWSFECLILMILTMTKYHENLLRDSLLSLLFIVKFFSSLETKMVLKIPNETFLRITRYLASQWVTGVG